MEKREIKFRAWDVNKHKMIDEPWGYPNESGWDDYMNINKWFEWSHIDSRNPIVLMQYTGLKDKNGKEIYEGDIIKWRKGTEGVWADQFWAFAVKFPFICGNAYLGEVIGNIYENPELLTEKV